MEIYKFKSGEWRSYFSDKDNFCPKDPDTFIQAFWQAYCQEPYMMSEAYKDVERTMAQFDLLEAYENACQPLLEWRDSGYSPAMARDLCDGKYLKYFPQVAQLPTQLEDLLSDMIGDEVTVLDRDIYYEKAVLVCRIEGVSQDVILSPCPVAVYNLSPTPK